MSRRYILLLIIAFIFTLNGCVHNNAHVKMIDAGASPSMVVISEVPNELTFQLIGFTMFQNGYHSAVVEKDLSSSVERYVTGALRRDGKVKVIDLDDSARDEFEKIRASTGVESDSQDYVSEKYRKEVSAWASARGIDFVLLVNRNSSESLMYGRAGRPYGLGILDDTVVGTYLHSVLKITLIDSKTSEISGESTASSFMRIPTIEADSERITPAGYEKLVPEQLAIVADRIDPVIKSNIEFILAKLGITAKESTYTWIDRMPDSDVPLF